MKNVLLLIHDDDGQEARLEVALDVVRAIGGHLTCLDVAVYTVLAGDDYGAGSATLYADECAREAKNKAKLERRLEEQGLPWDWIDANGSLAPSLIAAAGLTDLIIVNRKLDKFPAPDMLRVAGEVLLHAAKPMLAVPDTAKGLNLAGHVMIAWDGSASSKEALRLAVPLLRLAERVKILEIDDGSVTVPGEQAMAYLAENDIIASLHPKHTLFEDAGRDILQEITTHGPDYLVMGGYGHSRMREAVFGGVTRDLLSSCPVPLLLVH